MVVYRQENNLFCGTLLTNCFQVKGEMIKLAFAEGTKGI